jgi:hypothetical protein
MTPVVYYGEQHVEAETKYGIQLIANQQWLDLRHAHITGTGLVKVNGTKAAAKKYVEGIAWSINRKPRISEELGRLSVDVTRGNEMEPFATGAIIDSMPTLEFTPIMFIKLSDTFGISPDNITTDFSMAFEIKCLQEESTAEVVYNGIPKKNFDQLIGYFMVDTIQTVVYTVFCPGHEMADGQDYLHMTPLKREDHLLEIANMKQKLESADAYIKELRDK